MTDQRKTCGSARMWMNITVTASPPMLLGIDGFLRLLSGSPRMSSVRLSRTDDDARPDYMIARCTWSLACTAEQLQDTLNAAQRWLSRVPQALGWFQIDHGDGSFKSRLTCGDQVFFDHHYRPTDESAMKDAIGKVYDLYATWSVNLHDLVPSDGEEPPALVRSMLAPGGCLRRDPGVVA